MIRTKSSRSAKGQFSSLFVLVLLLAQAIAAFATINAAPAITVTAPTPGQAIVGTSFTARGTATPNTTVTLSSNGTTLHQLKSDGSGNWSANIDTLPAGEAQLTAKAIAEPEYGYFATTVPGFAATDFNQVRLSDNAINPNPGWPISLSAPYAFWVTSPTDNVFYSADVITGQNPQKFDADNPGTPQAVIDYPGGATGGRGDFSPDGAKFYVPNTSGLDEVTVVDVATNTATSSIPLGAGESAFIATRAGNGKIYISSTAEKIYEIDPATDQVVRTIPITGCSAPTVVTSVDQNYPYIYAPCNASGEAIKVALSDGSVVDTFTVGGTPVVGVLSLDNKRLFFNDGLSGGSNSDNIVVIDTESGALLQSVQLTAEGLAVAASSDFQRLYVGTPGSGFSAQNIDIVDTSTYQVTQLPVTNFPGAVVYSNSTAESVTVNVSFVLGAQATNTPVGELAKTGLFIALATPIGLFLILGSLYTYYDYLRHKNPLTEASAESVDYSYVHHLQVVTIPLAKYRLSIRVAKDPVPSKIRRI